MIGSEEKAAVGQMVSGFEVDVLVVQKAYEWPIIWIDYWGLGEKTPYLVDRTAKRTSEHSTSASLIGANWQKYKDDNGESKEFYGRSVPGYSRSLDEFTNIEEKIKRDGNVEQYIHGLVAIIGSNNIFNLIHATALQKCKAFILMEVKSK